MKEQPLKEGVWEDEKGHRWIVWHFCYADGTYPCLIGIRRANKKGSEFKKRYFGLDGTTHTKGAGNLVRFIQPISW